MNPFRKVALIGSKTIKILGYNTDQGLLVNLKASNGNNVIQRELIINKEVKEVNIRQSQRSVLLTGLGS